jgi:hypothetical protein
VLDGNGQVGFAVGSYDRGQPLVIDPLLSYSTYLGGNEQDSAIGIAVDSSGSAYLTGYTYSFNFPLANPIQRTLSLHSDPDAFVAKLNPAGSAHVYSTFLGGAYVNDGFGIAVDSAGNAYVTGQTDSSDFPTVNPLQSSLKGGQNAFVTKLNSTGSALVYSTFLGGSGNDSGIGIAVDSSGSAYVTGSTTSGNFPTVNPVQSQGNGIQNVFVAKLNPAGSALVYSTYLGGSTQFDEGHGIAVDASGNA